MWYIRVWIGPQSAPPGSMIGRFGVTGFVAGSGLRTKAYTTLGWAVLLPGRHECPYFDSNDDGMSMRTEPLLELAQIAQAGRYYSATWIYARSLTDDVR